MKTSRCFTMPVTYPVCTPQQEKAPESPARGRETAGAGEKLCFQHEGAVSPHGLIQVGFVDDLQRGVHGENGYAAVDDFHAVQSADIGDGAAAALIYLAQLGGLIVDIVPVKKIPQTADVFGVGIVAAALAPGAGIFVEAYPTAQEGGVLLSKQPAKLGS